MEGADLEFHNLFKSFLVGPKGLSGRLATNTIGRDTLFYFHSLRPRFHSRLSKPKCFLDLPVAKNFINCPGSSGDGWNLLPLARDVALLDAP